MCPPYVLQKAVISQGMQPEYTELDTLKNNARVWLEGRSMMRSGAARTALKALPQAGTPRGVPLRQVTPHAVSWAPTQTLSGKPVTPVRSVINSTSRSAPPTTGGTPRPIVPNTTKTCFACGIMGHIASDSQCSRFNKSASHAPGPALRAGRVDSSYSIEDIEECDVGRDREREPTEEELEGTWGGEQYDANELLDQYNYLADYEHEPHDLGEDPHKVPNLDTLLRDKEAPEIQVGAMHPIHQYFSMWVQPTDEQLPDTADRENAPDVTITGLHHLILDTDMTLVQKDMPPWMADGEHRALTE
ncbi:hypothetical protein K438DRAFT_1975724 [Mycena galopus ATCC 62051]|nr:hypothetical protein K438DRAFT_1975724 [Mycena galopus ATCC 62051]